MAEKYIVRKIINDNLALQNLLNAGLKMGYKLISVTETKNHYTVICIVKE